jgi:hypothetical protein
MGHARLGYLDIWAIYAPADCYVKRKWLWNTLQCNMKKDTLNVMVGDFNFVEHHGDRFKGDTHQFTGSVTPGEPKTSSA